MLTILFSILFVGKIIEEVKAETKEEVLEKISDQEEKILELQEKDQEMEKSYEAKVLGKNNDSLQRADTRNTNKKLLRVFIYDGMKSMKSFFKNHFNFFSQNFCADNRSYGVCAESTLPVVKKSASPCSLFAKSFLTRGFMFSSLMRMNSSRSGRAGVNNSLFDQIFKLGVYFLFQP